MTALVLPTVDRWHAWAAMIRDFGGPEEMHGSGHWNLEGEPVASREGCAAFVAMAESTAPGDPDRTPSTGKVPSTYFWIAAGDGALGDELVGFLNLRHELNDFLLEEGGHIGYAVAPSARRRGHASAALAASLPHARDLGLERVLVTCDLDNEPSARTIERNRGILEDRRNGKRRYWITVG